MNQATATYSLAERAAFIVKMLKAGADPDQMTAAIEGELRSVETDAFERGKLAGINRQIRVDAAARGKLGSKTQVQNP